MQTKSENNQYTNASAVQKFLTQKIQEKISIEEMKNFSLDIISTKDRKNQDFLYITLKDKGSFTDNSYNSELLERIGCIIKQSIQSHCSNLMEVVSAEEGSGRQLLWLPKNKNCFTLYESYDGIEEFSIKKLNNKIKVR